MKDITLIWFRRNLRLSDNIALSTASRDDNVAAIYIYDPAIILKKDFSYLHFDFIQDSLRELKNIFLSNGSFLNIYHNSVTEVLKIINLQFSIKKIISHHEIGNWAILNRDRDIKKYCQKNGIQWLEFQSNGVVRNLKDRDGWSKKWNESMNSEILETPNISKFITFKNTSGLLNHEQLGIKKINFDKLYKGGESEAKKTMSSFLNNRGQHYSKEMSSPLSAFSSCSRLSSYITYGNISIKQILREIKNQQKYLRENKIRTGWLKSLSSFSSRLRWHCHFIQKLEMQPDLEFTNMVRSYDPIRTTFNKDSFDRWTNGNTGFPMVDACMRSLKANGWINFRMRAMLVSFASYNLWLDWRITSKYLSNYFIDYEPGIHYNQFQMQSGVTGINAIRIYNPIKQQEDHDPNAIFVRKWIPELRNVPLEYIQYPHLLSEKMQVKTGCIIGKNYPEPVVDLKKSTLKAKKEIYKVKGSGEAKNQSKAAYLMHGSRKKSKSLNLFSNR